MLEADAGGGRRCWSAAANLGASGCHAVAAIRGRDAGARPCPAHEKPAPPRSTGQDALGDRPFEPLRYSEADALADLKRAGGDDESIKALTGGESNWPEGDREPLEFARLLTTAAPTIPDELFERLRTRFGDKQVAAMVLLGAYGNFQDRIILGLSLPLEPNGPLAPLQVKFSPGAFQATPLLPPQAESPALLTAGETVVERDPEWSELSFNELQARLERQRARKPRLPIPSWDEVKKKVPAAFAARPTRIVWNLVCSGYVPELAIPWSVSTRTMWAEAKPNRVFEESLFWVQTRSIRCNYCMGHCEMLLEVAGLDRNAVLDRTRRLAGDDWSCFPPEEQHAFAYARKLTKTPWDLTTRDFKLLETDMGPAKAMATFWWLCRGLYMTRVSDGFQLPLERDNVFADFFGKGAEPARNPPMARPAQLCSDSHRDPTRKRGSGSPSTSELVNRSPRGRGHSPVQCRRSPPICCGSILCTERTARSTPRFARECGGLPLIRVCSQAHAGALDRFLGRHRHSEARLRSRAGPRSHLQRLLGQLHDTRFQRLPASTGARQHLLRLVLAGRASKCATDIGKLSL